MEGKVRRGKITGSVIFILILLASLILLLSVIYIRIGNPLSFFAIKNKAESYIENDASDDFSLIKYGFDFKERVYFANYQHKTDDSKSFYIYYDMLGNKINKTDSEVEKAHNEAILLEEEYNNLFKNTVMYNNFTDYKIEGNASLAVAHKIDRSIIQYLDSKKDSEGKSDLVLIAKDCGSLQIEAESSEVTAEKAAKIMCDLKEALIAVNLPFKNMTLVLNKAGDELQKETLVFLAVPESIIGTENMAEKLNSYTEIK